MTEINKLTVGAKIALDPPDHGSDLAPEPPISTIRGMCRGINTDMPNDVEDTQGADDLITLKAAARVAWVKRARKITLDDL